jgi:integrase/recombinase XerD
VPVDPLRIIRSRFSGETTRVSIKADLATKERALQKLMPAEEKMPRFKADDQPLAFLPTL